MSPDRIRTRARWVKEFLDTMLDLGFLDKLPFEILNLKHDFAGRLLKDNTEFGVSRESSPRASCKKPRIKHRAND